MRSITTLYEKIKKYIERRELERDIIRLRKIRTNCINRDKSWIKRVSKDDVNLRQLEEDLLSSISYMKDVLFDKYYNAES